MALAQEKACTIKKPVATSQHPLIFPDEKEINTIGIVLGKVGD